MKFSHLRLVLLMVLALFAFGCNGKRVAIVNTDSVYKSSAASEKGSEYLKSLSAGMQAKYEAGQAKIQTAKNKEDKAAAEAEMQMILIELQQRSNAEQQQVVMVLSEAYKKAMDNCRVKGGFDLIIPSEAALAYDEAIDLTTKVIEEMNAMPIAFTPIEPEAPAEQPAK